MTEYRYIHNSSGRLVRVDALGRLAPGQSACRHIYDSFSGLCTGCGLSRKGATALRVATNPPAEPLPSEPAFRNVVESPAAEPGRCAECGAYDHPLNEGQLCDSCYERPEPKPTRRFCACGQELFGKFLADPAPEVACGDCVGTWEPSRGVDIQEQRRVSPSLDQRIRAVQPETEEHAFERPGYSWP